MDEYSVFDEDSNVNTTNSYEVYEYNDLGQLETILRRRTNFSMISRKEFHYDAKGNLILWELYNYTNNQAELMQHTEIVPGDETFPQHWNKLLITPDYLMMYELTMTGKKYTGYYGNVNGLTTNYNIKTKAYNEGGFPATITFELETLGATSTFTRTYEYIE